MKKPTVALIVLTLAAFVACAKKNAPASVSKAESPPPKGAAAKPHAAIHEARPTEKTPAKAEATAEMGVVNVTKDGITVQRAIACRSVENKSPVGEAEAFPKDVGRVYLFTQVQKSTDEETSIQHVWNHEGKKMGTVTLPVRGTRWRTYSSKMIDPSWKGNWSVDVTTAKGEIIHTVAFKIE